MVIEISFWPHGDWAVCRAIFASALFKLHTRISTISKFNSMHLYVRVKATYLRSAECLRISWSITMLLARC